MPAPAQTRHIALLGAGFAASLVVALGFAGPYLAYDGQPLVEQLIVTFLMPVTGAVIYVLLRSLQTRRAPADGNPLADAPLQGILFWILFFLISVHVLLLLVLTRTEWAKPFASRGVIVALGITLAAIGNLLPRTRPNFALGIRTARTLSDRQLWMLTHRASGYLLVAIGLATIVSGLFAAGTSVMVGPVIGGAVGIAVLVAYYWHAARTTGATS